MAARAIILAVALIPTSMLMLTGRRLDVPLPVSAAGALLIGCLPQLGQAELWWSNALLVVPGFAATMTCLWLLVGPHGEGPRAKHAALGGLVFAIGLGFYDKNLFAVVLFWAVLLACHLRQGGLFESAKQSLFDLRFVLLVALAWSIALLLLREPNPEVPGLSAAIQFMWLAWSDAALGALFGFGSTGVPVVSPWVSPLISHGLLVLLVWYSLRQGGVRSLAIWIALSLYIGATLILTARMRAGPFGPEFGRTLRYAVEPAAFIVVAAVLSLAGSSPRRSWPLAIALSALAFFIGTSVDIPSIGEPKATRTYVLNLRQSIQAVGSNVEQTVLDSPLPEMIMAGWMAPLNVPSRFVPLVAKNTFSYGDGATANLEVDRAGFLRSRH
jgi:hypothetical protein